MIEGDRKYKLRQRAYVTVGPGVMTDRHRRIGPLLEFHELPYRSRFCLIVGTMVIEQSSTPAL